ncbi:hypothetical protein [Vibrio bivalvicida]|uniref:(d)CMP kinase n=1 Tax=Vibrio bivalvicida TaxID=1276888 RepID=A0ABV4MIJ6_9VIBR
MLIIDGCDATGKTSVGKCVAAKIGAIYVKPFERVDSSLIWLHKNGYYEQFVSLAETMLNHWVTQYPTEDLVFDRGWITVNAIANTECEFRRRDDVISILLTSDIDVILNRHEERNEKYCLKFLNAFQESAIKIADRFNIQKIDTSRSSISMVASKVYNIYEG